MKEFGSLFKVHQIEVIFLSIGQPYVVLLNRLRWNNVSRVAHWEGEEYASNAYSSVDKAILLLTDGIGLESVKCVDICRVGSPTETL